MLRSGGCVLPFALVFAVVSALAGDPARAVAADCAWLPFGVCGVVTHLDHTDAGSDRGPRMAALSPRFLLQVMQFLYRYLIVLMEEAGAMRQAEPGARRVAPYASIPAGRSGGRGVVCAIVGARAGDSSGDDLARDSTDTCRRSRGRGFGWRTRALLAAAALLIAGMRVAFDEPDRRSPQPSYTYEDGTQALNGVDFDLEDGATVALLGANGSGKTTFVHHLNGILHGSGSVVIDGLPVTEKNLREIRKRVGLVFQDSDNQLFMPSVMEDVAFGPLASGMPQRKRRNGHARRWIGWGC